MIAILLANVNLVSATLIFYIYINKELYIQQYSLPSVAEMDITSSGSPTLLIEGRRQSLPFPRAAGALPLILLYYETNLVSG